jgi:hypothetical protein
LYPNTAFSAIAFRLAPGSLRPFDRLVLLRPAAVGADQRGVDQRLALTISQRASSSRLNLGQQLLRQAGSARCETAPGSNDRHGVVTARVAPWMAAPQLAVDCATPRMAEVGGNPAA